LGYILFFKLIDIVFKTYPVLSCFLKIKKPKENLFLLALYNLMLSKVLLNN